MLGTLLDKLQGLFSKTLLVGSLPLLAFGLLNGIFAWSLFPSAKSFLAQLRQLDGEPQGLLLFATVVGVAVLGFAFASCTEFLRNLLAGKYGIGPSLARVLSREQRDELQLLTAEREGARQQLRFLRRQREDWITEMRTARLAAPAGGNPPYQRPAQLTDLMNRLESNQSIDGIQIGQQVAALVSSMAQGMNPALDADHVLLVKIIDYAIGWHGQNYADAQSHIQFDFAGTNVAPTRFGTIANTVSNYAATRYGINIEIFWTRLLGVIDKDAPFMDRLGNAQMQLDFSVALFWLTLLFTLTWIVLIPLYGGPWQLLLVTALAGPVLLKTWYWSAVQNQRVVCDLVRSAVDLYRFDLLKALHVELPSSIEQEQKLWLDLEQLYAYGSRVNMRLQNG